MAQTTRSKAKTSTGRGGSRSKPAASAKRAGSKSAASKRAGSKSAASNRKRASSNGASAKSTSGGPKATAGAVAAAASKAKTPLIAGATALAGAAAGAAIKGRAAAKQSKNPLKRLSGISVPKPGTKLDLDTVKSAAERVSAYSRQAADVADAVEKTRKKNK